MTDEQIKHMTERFLSWKLPADFHPDAGISFKAELNDSPAAMAALGLDEPMRHEPVGTNLFTYTQAEAMVRHMLDGLPRTPDEGLELRREARSALSTIRHQWAGHAEECAYVQDYDNKCDCDWSKIAAKCDKALSRIDAYLQTKEPAK